jgi:hypothetical protein
VQLATIEASLAFVAAATASNGPNSISVNPSTANVFYAAAWSLSNKCFSIKDDTNLGTTYAQPAVTQANCASSNAGVTGATYGTSW